MKIRVLVVENGSDCSVREITQDSAGFKTVQEIVGGYVEVVRPIIAGVQPPSVDLTGVRLCLNEDGRSMKLPVHQTPFWPEPIRGNYVLVQTDSEGGFAGLSDAEAARFMAMVHRLHRGSK